MPAGDQTGPQGMGPASGRGAVQCTTGQVNNPRSGLNSGRGRGCSRGRGQGQGRGQGRCGGA